MAVIFGCLNLWFMLTFDIHFSPLGIAFDYLYANTLKRNSGINYINSPWKIKEIELLSMYSVLFSALSILFKKLINNLID